MALPDDVVFTVKGLTKSFGGVQALTDVSLSFRRGEVHAVVGENGAGKSTLMRIIGGVIQPDKGQMLYKGQEVRFGSPKDSLKTGIALIHQELSNMPSLSVIENIFMGRMDSRLGIVKQAELERKTVDVLDLLGLDIDPYITVKRLSASQRQLVEIAKALSMNANLIMMDEPNSSLTDVESERLFRVIEDLKHKGISIIYVSHTISEVLKISDRISVLRDGRLIGTVEGKNASADQVIQMMVGRNLEFDKLKKAQAKGHPILKVNGLTGHGFRNVSFDLRKGEILGFAGLVGAGRSEVARAVFGATGFTSGSILLEDKPVKFRSPAEAIKHGIAMLQEDRTNLSLFMGLSIGLNMSLSALPELSRFGVVDSQRVKEILDEYRSKLSIKLGDLRDPISSLSGGNQQKAVLARWLSINPKVLILDEPTHGIDVGAKLEIYKLMRSFAEKGISMILISSELPEIISMSDRVVVMSEGSVTAVLENDEITEENIMRFAAYKTEERA